MIYLLMIAAFVVGMLLQSDQIRKARPLLEGIFVGLWLLLIYQLRP